MPTVHAAILPSRRLVPRSHPEGEWHGGRSKMLHLHMLNPMDVAEQLASFAKPLHRPLPRLHRPQDSRRGTACSADS